MDADDRPPPPRASPLSAENLKEVRSLIDPSSGEPLDGRRVMVPLTTKAFFEGTLRPTPASTSSVAASGLDAASPIGDDTSAYEGERLLVNLEQGYLAEMTRADASALVDRRIALTSSASRDARVRKETSVNSDNNERAESKGAQKILSEASDNLAMKTQPETLPFFEIREEYDERGNEISAQAYNVADELMHLQREVKNKAKSGGKEAGEISEMIGNMRTDADDDAVESETSPREDISMDADPSKKEVTSVTDEKFEALSARLDELALMEEEDARSKKSNATSRQRIQGNAWGKGFLESSARKKAKPEPINQNMLQGSDDGEVIGEQKLIRKIQRKKAKKKGWAKGFLNTESDVMKRGKGEEPENLKSSTDGKPTEAKRKVAFGADNVKEIPRIGHASVKGAAKVQRSAAPKPFARDAFSGVVEERPVDRKQSPVTVGQVSERIGGIPSVNEEHSEERAPKKKMSRFAQQRQQLR